MIGTELPLTVTQMLWVNLIMDTEQCYEAVSYTHLISDNMELEIANYLNQVSEGRLSSESKLQIRAMSVSYTHLDVYKRQPLNI